MTHMTKIGRNAPCACGSGKKYKRCCLPADEKAQRDARPPVAQKPSPRSPWLACNHDHGEDPIDYRELTELSNRVPDLLDEGRVDEAEEVCHELLRRFPEVTDGIERLGHVHEVRGDLATAAAHYRKAAAIIRETAATDDEHALWLDQLADRVDPAQSS